MQIDPSSVTKVGDFRSFGRVEITAGGHKYRVKSDDLVRFIKSRGGSGLQGKLKGRRGESDEPPAPKKKRIPKPKPEKLDKFKILSKEK